MVFNRLFTFLCTLLFIGSFVSGISLAWHFKKTKVGLDCTFHSIELSGFSRFRTDFSLSLCSRLVIQYQRDDPLDRLSRTYSKRLIQSQQQLRIAAMMDQYKTCMMELPLSVSCMQLGNCNKKYCMCGKVLSIEAQSGVQVLSVPKHYGY